MKRIVPFAESSSGPGEHLAAGHVVLAVRVDPRAALDAKAQIGALRLDPDLVGARELLTDGVLALGELVPRGDRVGTVQKESAVNEPDVLHLAHRRLLGERRRRPQRPAPALLKARLLDRGTSSSRAGDQLGVDAGQRFRVARRSDRDERICSLGLFKLERRERIQLRVAGVPVELGGKLLLREPHQRPGAAFEQCPVESPHQRHGLQCGRDQYLVSFARGDAPVRQERGVSVRVQAPHGASSSGKCSARCSRIASRTKRRSSVEASR